MGVFQGTVNRILQLMVRFAPGAKSLRVWMHRLRGVHVGAGVFIGTDALIETAQPHLVYIGDGAVIGIRTTIIAHGFGLEQAAQRKGRRHTVIIEDKAYIGASVTILPNVTIGRGAVVNAGSVVTRSVPPLTMVQGNPAVPVAKCGIPLSDGTPLKEFYRQIKPLGRKGKKP